MTSDTARRNNELRKTEDLLETSQSIMQNFKLQREAALKKQQHVMKTLKSMSFNTSLTDTFSSQRNSPIQSINGHNSSLEFRVRHVNNLHIPTPTNGSPEINYHPSYHVRPPSRTYSPSSYIPHIDPCCSVPEHRSLSREYERFPIASPILHTNKPDLSSCYDHFKFNTGSMSGYIDDQPSHYYRPKSVNSDYHQPLRSSEFSSHYDLHYEHENPVKQHDKSIPIHSPQTRSASDQVSNIDSQTLIRLLTGPKSDAELEILKELARREGFNDDVIGQLSRSTGPTLINIKERELRTNTAKISKKFQDSDKEESSSSELSISTPKIVNGRMRFRVGSLSTSLDCDDSSVVSSLPTTERTPSTERKKSNESAKCSLGSENHEKVTPAKEDEVKPPTNVHKSVENEEVEKTADSEPEENSILSPLPKKSKCSDIVQNDDSSIPDHIKEPQTSAVFSQPVVTKTDVSKTNIFGSHFNTTYTFKSAASGEVNETTDEETSTETPKSFHSEESGSHSSVSTGYRIQSVAEKERNPFSITNPSSSKDFGGIWKYLRDYSATNKKFSSTSSLSKEDEQQQQEEFQFHLDSLTEFEADKMNNVLKLSRREKELCNIIDKKISGIKLLENILKETTEKAISEQRQLSELKKERREIRKQRKNIFSELSNQPVSESEMPESARNETSRVSPLNLTCDSDSRPTPSYPMNRPDEIEDGNCSTPVPGGVRFDDELQTDRTDVLLLKSSYAAISKEDNSSDSETLSDRSTVKLNFGDTTVRDIIDRVIEAENRIVSGENEKEEDPLQNDLQRLMQEYLSEMVAHETLQKELRENIPNFDDIEKSISQQVHQMHVQAEAERKGKVQHDKDEYWNNNGHLSDVLSARDPPVKFADDCSKSQDNDDVPTKRTEDLIRESSQRDDDLACSDDALFNNLKRQYTFLKDIKPYSQPVTREPEAQKNELHVSKSTCKQSDIKEIQANVMRLMNSSASEASTPTTQRSEVTKPKFNKLENQNPLQKTGNYSHDLPDLNYNSSQNESDYQLVSGCSSVPTSDLLKRVASEGFLHLSSDSHRDKSRKSDSKNKRPRSRRSIDPKRSATLKKYLHASSSSDLTDFDSPRVPITKYQGMSSYGHDRSSVITDRPSSAAARIPDS